MKLRAAAVGGARRGRIDAVDLVRGIAILGVVVFHFFWDLSFLWLIETDVSTHPAWVLFARSLLFSFVFLVGVGLVLSHRQRIVWRSVWRRFAIIGGAALLVTIGTLIAFRESFVYFGVLHAIALFSLLGLPFLFLPTWAVILIGLTIFLAPFVVTHPVFEAHVLSWIGFYAVPPQTNDLVPIFPWFGATLLGVGLARLAYDRGWFDRLARWRAPHDMAWIVRAGQLSLPIYLIHQPLLLAVLVPLANFVLVDRVNINSFNRTCQIGCLNTGQSKASCTTYCGCMLDQVNAQDLWDEIAAPTPTADQSAAVNAAIMQCSVSDLPDLDDVIQFEPPID